MKETKKLYFLGMVFLLLLGLKATAAGIVVSSENGFSSAEKEALFQFSADSGIKQVPGSIFYAEANELSPPSREGGIQFQKFSGNALWASSVVNAAEPKINSYLFSSRNIEPGLGLKKIIFPFHLFW